MSSNVYGLSFDAGDAAAAATFWADVLGSTVEPGATTDNAVVSSTDRSPRIGFHRVPEDKTVKNRLHLDLVTDDLAAESARVLALGATRLNDVTAGSARWTTFADVEGNEFDVIGG